MSEPIETATSRIAGVIPRFGRKSRRERTRQPALRVTSSVLEQIRATVGSTPAEQGGILGGNREDGVVRHFLFDSSSTRSRVTYTPDHEFLNSVLKSEWNPNGINLLGFVHSHPRGASSPSSGDLAYARAILGHIPDLSRLLLPIVITEPDSGSFQIRAYAAVRNQDDISIEELELVVEEEENSMLEASAAIANEVEESVAGDPVADAGAVHTFDIATTFARVRGAYDLERLRNCRAIYVGAGGASAFIEDMARAGVGEHVLIDPDTVSETNLATQQVYRRDLGRPKVDCIAERLRDINPTARVTACHQRLEEIADADFRRLAAGEGDGREGSVTVVFGLTDAFEAQARVNRLALELGLPSLCAQVYLEGRGAEITFTYPGVTPACHRCILKSRYRAYLQESFRNDVTSDGTPIFATTRLNALKGFLAMALFHHGMHPYEIRPTSAGGSIEKPMYRRWGTLLSRLSDRNLVQIRMDPDLGLGVFDRVFGGGDTSRMLFDEVVWLPQAAETGSKETGPCPDCGGTGDLRDAIGSFCDTLTMRR